MKTNPVHVVAAVLIIPMLLPLYFVCAKDYPAGSGFEISGILATLIGTLWLAAGVYISRIELQEITKTKPKRAIGRMRDVLSNASHHIGLGVIYLVAGAGVLVFKSLGSALHWRGF